MYRSFRKNISLLILCCIMLVALGCNVHAEPTKVNLSVEEKNRLDTFFSNFAEAFLEPFAYGQLNNDQMIEFAFFHLVHNKQEYKFYKDMPSADFDKVTYRYFGKVANAEEHRKYFYDNYIFENGVYKILRKNFGKGEMLRFAVIEELWNNGDGTYVAIVANYYPMDGWRGDYHGTVEEWEKGDPDFWPVFKGKYRALIRLVHDGDYERYILLEYLLAQ